MNKNALVISIVIVAFIALLFLFKSQGVIGEKNTIPLESSEYHDMEIIEVAPSEMEMENVDTLPSDEILSENCADYAKGDGIPENSLPVYMKECIEDLRDQYLSGETINKEDEAMDDEIIMPDQKTP